MFENFSGPSHYLQRGALSKGEHLQRELARYPATFPQPHATLPRRIARTADTPQRSPFGAGTFSRIKSAAIARVDTPERKRGPRDSERVANGSAYEEGLGAAWAPDQRYWRDPMADSRNPSVRRWIRTSSCLTTIRDVRHSRYNSPSGTRCADREGVESWALSLVISAFAAPLQKMIDRDFASRRRRQRACKGVPVWRRCQIGNRFARWKDTHPNCSGPGRCLRCACLTLFLRSLSPGPELLTLRDTVAPVKPFPYFVITSSIPLTT